LVKKAVEYINDASTKLGGQLGKTTGARYRAYMRLDTWLKQNTGTLFESGEIKRTHEDIYNYPLRDYAKEVINRELKSGVSESSAEPRRGEGSSLPDEQLIELLTGLREKGELSIKDEDSPALKEPRIICSMGLQP
jgi:hypothetical protein